MVARRRGLVSGLFLATTITVFFFNVGLWPANPHSHSLAEDVLRTARESVQSLFGDEPRTTSRLARGLSTKLEQLRVSLDSFDQSFRNLSLQEPIDSCASLAGKRITMIGGEHIYRLHVLLLQHRERTEGKPFPCLYHEFCTHHHICLPRDSFQAGTVPPRHVKPPTAQELIDTESAAINYIISDTLRSTRNDSSWEYTLPFVDPTTGVRLRETYWLAAARKANIVILGRGPLSAPVETYTGNWSFLYNVPDYVNRLRAGSGIRDDDHVGQLVPRSIDVFNVAVHLTVSRFLPDLFQLLQAITSEVHPHRQKRLIWPSSWYRLPGRGVARTMLFRALIHSRVQDMLRYSPVPQRRRRSPVEHILLMQLSALINSDATKTIHLEDPWTLLFNAQVYLQNMVLREILPRHGIAFLPLDVSWVEDDPIRSGGRRYTHSTAANVDLERTTAVGEAFITKMDYILRYLE